MTGFWWGVVFGGSPFLAAAAVCIACFWVAVHDGTLTPDNSTPALEPEPQPLRVIDFEPWPAGPDVAAIRRTIADIDFQMWQNEMETS